MIDRVRKWLANSWPENACTPRVPRRHKLAVYIDCDGVSAKDASSVLEWLEPHAKVELRAYGNFTGSAGATWSRLVTGQSVTSRHMAKMVAGKNASDIALTIDAIETLLSTDIDTFVLIASDSDFAPLAQRIKAQGKEVMGFGQQSAPKAFRTACTTFKEFRHLNVHPSIPLPAALWSLQPGDAEEFILEVLHATLGGQEEVAVSELAHQLRQRHTSFDPRVFRRRNLGELLRDMPSVRLRTTARLAMALLLFTSQRRGDVVMFGPKHVHDGWLHFTQQKIGSVSQSILRFRYRQS